MMRLNHKTLPSLLLVTSLLAPACGRPTVPPRTAPQAIGEKLPPLSAAGRAHVDDLLRTLSLQDKVAQLVMPWITGTYQSLDDPGMQQTLRWVDSLKVGGIIVSIGSPTEIAAKVNALQRAAPLPLLIASDLEGGTTIRFSEGGTPFPTQMGIAAGGRLQDAWEMGRITAIEGRAAGIHLAFAPVADINSNPSNPIINTRSFGADPRTVSQFVAATVRGMREGGILSTAKHFPGHGDTDTDSHLSLPVIAAPWARFDTLELVPFRGAIEAGVDAIMSAHIAVPGLDGNTGKPGTLVPAILNGLLRDSLKFQGLVVTDALNMGAIVAEFGPEEASILAFLAGSDILLMPTDAGAAISAMTAAVRSGRISNQRLDASVRRVLELKERLGLFQAREVDLSRVSRVIGQKAFQQIGREVTERAMVLLKDSLEITARLKQGPRSIALIVRADQGSALGNAMAAELKRQGHTVEVIPLPAELSEQQRDQILKQTANLELALFVTAIKAVAWQGSVALQPQEVELLTRLNRQKPTMLLSFGSPYLISQLPDLAGFAIGWTNHPVAETAMAAALGGVHPFSGKLPIPVPPFWPIGGGIQTR